jgi:hypothetical protein
MIGRNEAADIFTVLYADDRGSSRVYDMTFTGSRWTMHRNSPSSEQRFTANVSTDQRTIEACWEHSNHGTTWEKEFDLTYTGAITESVA